MFPQTSLLRVEILKNLDRFGTRFEQRWEVDRRCCSPPTVWPRSTQCAHLRARARAHAHSHARAHAGGHPVRPVGNSSGWTRQCRGKPRPAEAAVWWRLQSELQAVAAVHAHADCSKVSLKLAAGCSEENMVELLAGIPGVQPVGKRSSWLNYRYFVHSLPR